MTVSDTVKRNIGRAVEPDADAKDVLEDIAAKAHATPRPPRSTNRTPDRQTT